MKSRAQRRCERKGGVYKETDNKGSYLCSFPPTEVTMTEVGDGVLVVNIPRELATASKQIVINRVAGKPPTKNIPKKKTR